MANNYISLKCAECGEELFLGKSCCEGAYYVSYDGVPLEDKLNEFYDTHAHFEDPDKCNVLGTNFYIDHFWLNNGNAIRDMYPSSHNKQLGD